MKKFLSYLMVFVMVFAISTTVTIKVKSQLLDNSPATVAEASGETSLLSGVMSSIEKNPKLSVGGNLSLSLQDDSFDIALSADLNMKELTNPEVSGHVTIKHDANTLDLFVTYVGGTIYIAYGNVKVKATLSDIQNSVASISQLFEELGFELSQESSSTVDGLAQSFAGISADSLLDALSNPKKTVFEDYDQYEISLPNICDVVLICDEKFNISAVSINNFTLIENVSLVADLFVAQDEQIEIEAPKTENYFDIASAIDGVSELFAEDYIYASAWVSLYKNNRLAESAKVMANLDIANNNYALEGKFSGLIDANIDAKYLQDKLFVKFNDINLSATNDTIAMLVETIKANFDTSALQLPEMDAQELVLWIKNNYKNLLDNAIISDTTIKLDLNLSNFVEGLDNLEVLLKFRDSKIESISIDGLQYGEYMLRCTIYLDYPTQMTLNANEQEYFAAETLIGLADTIKNLQKFEVSANVAATINQTDYNVNLAVLGDAQNNNYQASLSGLFGLDVDFAYLNSATYEYPIYLRVGDIYLSVPKNYLEGIVGDKVQEIISSISLPQKEEIFAKAKELLSTYWIGDILKLSTIKLNKNTLEISANLTALVHKTCRVELVAQISENMLDIQSFEFEYDGTKISGDFKFATTDKTVDVQNKTKYLDIKWLINNLQTYLAAESLSANAELEIANEQQTLASFSGNIGASLAQNKLALDGSLKNLLGKFDLPQNVRVVYDGSKLYFEYGAQKFDISENVLTNLLSEFGYDVAPYLQKAKDIFARLSSLNIYDFAKDKVNSLNISLGEIENISIDQQKLLAAIELVKGIKINSNQIAFAGNVMGTDVDANIKLYANHLAIFANIQMNGMKVNANIDLSKANVNFDTSADSVCVDPVAKIIEKIATIASASAFEGRANISFGTEAYKNIAVEYKLAIDTEQQQINGLVVAEVCGKQIKIKLQNNKLYLNVSGAYVVCTIEDIFAILHDDLVKEYLPEEFANFDIENIDIQAIISKVLEFAAQTKLIESIEEVGQNLEINIMNKANVVLNNISEQSLSAQVELDGVSVEFSLETREDLELEQVDEEKYQSLLNLFSKLKKAYNFGIGKKYFANIVAGLGFGETNINLAGYVGYDQDGLAVNVSTTLLGKAVDIKVLQRVVYIDIDGLKLHLSFEDIASLLSGAVSTFELDIDQEVIDFANSILTEQNIDFANLIEQAKALLPQLDIGELVRQAEIVLLQDALQIDILGASIEIAFDQQDNISNLNVLFENEKLDVLANIELCNKKQVAISGTYASLADATNILPAIKKLANKLEYVANVNFAIGENNFDVAVGIKIENKRIFLQASAELFEKHLLATFDYDEANGEYALQVELDGACVRGTLDDVPAIVDWINQTFDKDIQIDIEFIKQVLETLDIEKLLSKINFGDVALSLENKTLSLQYNGILIELVLDDQISGKVCANGNTLCTLALEQTEVVSKTKAQNALALADVFEIVKNAYSYVASKEYYALLSVDFELSSTKDGQTKQTTISVTNAYLGYDADGLVLDAELELFEKTLHLVVANKVVYIDFDGFKAKLGFADAYDLLEKVVQEFELNLSEDILNLAKYLLTEEIDAKELISKVSAISGDSVEIENIIKDASISLSLEKLALEILGANIDVEFENSNIAKIVANYQSHKEEETKTTDISVSAQIQISQKQNIALAGEYADLAGAKDLISSIKDIIDAKQIVGTISINFDKIDIDGQIKVNFADGLALELSFDIYGLEVNIKFVNKTVYVQIEDIKVKASIDDLDNIIDWANQTFDANINLGSGFDIEGMSALDLLSKIDFGAIVLSIQNSAINFAYKEVSANIDLSGGIAATITYQKAAQQGEEQRKPLIITLDANVQQTAIEVVDEEYSSYTILTDLVDSVMQIVKDKKVAITLPNVRVYEGTSVHYTASGRLQLDLSDENNKLFHAQVMVNDLAKGKSYDVRLSYRNNYWWIYFNNLKLKMAKADVKELLAIVCKVMDLDTTLIPGLAEVSASLDDINFESLSAVLPNFKDFDPLSILGYIKSLTLSNGQLVCDIDGHLVTTNENATDMRVVVDASTGRLSQIRGENIYTGVTNAEHLDITLVVEQWFDGVESPASGNYIDLSGSNELIKALFNTAELNYFDVSGKIAASLGSWDLVDIPLVLQVKLDENRKPIIYAKLDLSVLTDSLISSAANSIVFEKIYKNNHIVEIYYKDGYVYFHSTGNGKESLFSSTTYAAKMVKVHIDSLLEDPMYYLNFALSFSDTIENEINKSIEKNADHEPDLGKIIKSYTVSGSRNFEVVLDMEEISGDSVLSDTSINIGVINNSSTGGKNYIGTAGFDFQLSVGLTIHLSSDDLKLQNIGKPINFTAIENFINNYAYGEGREMTSTNGGSSYSQSGGKQYSVAFNSNGGTSVATKTGYAGTTFALPTLANKVIAVDGGKDVYAFAGWYEDDTLLKTPYTQGVIGHTNITVYAKWELVEQYRNISFFVDGTKVATELLKVGSNISYSGLIESRIVENGGYKYYQSFAGYTFDNGEAATIVGTTAQNVYVNYANTEVLKIYALAYETGIAEPIVGTNVYETESYAIPTMPETLEVYNAIEDSTKIYEFGGWFVDEDFAVAADGIMPSHNLTLYAKWIFVREYATRLLVIYDNGAQVFNKRIEVGTAVDLSSSGIKIDQYTQWYLEAGYSTQVALPATMPNANTTLHVRNRYVLTTNYYVVENNNLVLKTKTENVYQGENFVLQSQTNPNPLDYGSGTSFYRMIYTFDGYYNNTTKVASSGIMPNDNITFVSKYNSQKQFKVTFDVRTYKLKHQAGLTSLTNKELSWSGNASFTPSAEYINENATINVSGSKYQPTRKATYSYWGTKTITLKATTWGTSAWANYTSGGSGKTSFKITSSCTLYACWAE